MDKSANFLKKGAALLLSISIIFEAISPVLASENSQSDEEDHKTQPKKPSVKKSQENNKRCGLKTAEKKTSSLDRKRTTSSKAEESDEESEYNSPLCQTTENSLVANFETKNSLVTPKKNTKKLTPPQSAPENLNKSKAKQEKTLPVKNQEKFTFTAESKKEKLQKEKKILSNTEIKDYDSDDELNIHLKTQKKFFQKESRKQFVKNAIVLFKDQYEDPDGILSPIPLKNLSSRSRVMIFQTISKIVREKSNDNLYFKDEKYGRESLKKVPFKLDNLSFTIQYKPTFSQPGNFWAMGLPDYADVYEVLDNEEKNTPNQSTATRLVFTKKTKNASNYSFANELSILLDLEIARRLEENDGYKIPVASAISKHIIKSSKEEKGTKLLFQVDGRDDPNQKFPYGSYNTFQGKERRRKTAIKNILRKEKNSTHDEIRQEYLGFYGGKSESESEDDESSQKTDDEVEDTREIIDV